MRKPEVLYQEVVEIEERVVLVPPEEEGGTSDDSGADVVVGVTGEKVRVERPMNEAAVRTQLQAVYDKVGGWVCMGGSIRQSDRDPKLKTHPFTHNSVIT